MKITSLTCLILIVLAPKLSGQDRIKSASKAGYKRWQVGINFSPDFCFRTLKYEGSNPVGMELLNERNANEIGKPGFTTGLDLVYNFKESFALEGGIQYSNKGYQTRMEDLTIAAPVDPRRGFISILPGPVPIKSKVVYKHHYLEIPLKVNIALGKEIIRFIASAGVTTNIFLGATTTSVLEFDDGTQRKNTRGTNFAYNRINVSPLVSAGIDWKLNARSNIRIEPTFRYGLLKIIDAPLTGYLGNVGLNISYYLGLK